MLSEISERGSKSETKTPLPKCKAERHHKILFVGEGNFSFSKSLLEKHNQKFHTNDKNFLKITASDLYISETVSDQFKDCDDVLKQNEVIIYKCLEESCGRNDEKYATKINELNERYSKIYWSMPHDRSSFSSPSLPNLISNFCLSCSEVQNIGDKVHLIISQTLKKPNPTYHTEFQQGMVYNIIEGPFIAGYILEKRIRFDDQRYKGYTHQQTKGEKNVENGNNRMEFVFKKSGEILENYKNIAPTLRSVGELKLDGNDNDKTNQYMAMIKKSYTNIKFYEKKGYRRFYITDDDYIPQLESDNYYDDSDHDGGNDDEDSVHQSFLDIFNGLSSSDKSRQL
ncbi:hypothetical protein ACTFIZ_005984 [Dictyostelium cf. discoideum]